MIKVAIADDHSLVRQGLRRYLDMADGIEVVGEASDGRELLTLIEEHDPDIALVDIRMPEMDGLEAAREIRDRFPKVGVIMLTAYDDRQFVVEAVRSGARGYVLKARDAEHLIQTVRLVAGGNMVIDPQLVVALAEELSTAKERDRRAETLTAREIEVLEPRYRRASVHLARHGEDPPRAHLREAGCVGPYGGRRRGTSAPPDRVAVRSYRKPHPRDRWGLVRPVMLVRRPGDGG
jgi:DNA-binding NarL/FixJ family response regulator